MRNLKLWSRWGRSRRPLSRNFGSNLFGRGRTATFESLERRRLMVVNFSSELDLATVDTPFNFVGRVIDHGESTYGTGSLIQYHWVLTAAHVVDAAVRDLSFSMISGALDFQVTERWVADGWNGDGSSSSPDIALLKIETDVRFTTLPHISQAPPNPGSDYLIAGYGNSNYGATTNDGDQSGGIKRVGTVNINQVASGLITDVFSQGWAAAAPGDSGAPLVSVDANFSNYKIFGISSTSQLPVVYGVQQDYARVDGKPGSMMFRNLDTGEKRSLAQLENLSSIFNDTADRTAPSVSAPTSTIFVQQSNAAGATVNFPISVTDDRDPAPHVSVSHPSGSFFPLGTTQVDITATDNVGNESNASFKVVVTPNPALSGFGTPVPVDFQTREDDLLAIDVNRDGLPDLVTSGASKISSNPNVFDSGIYVSLNLGGQRFSASTYYHVSNWSSGGYLRTGDFNNDGNPDVLAFVPDTSDRYAVVLGDSLGRFQVSTVGTTPTIAPFDAVVADFNGDSKADIAFQGAYIAEASILNGNGNGTFGQGKTIPTDQTGYSLAYGDFNRDGILDVASGGSFFIFGDIFGNTDDTIKIFFGRPDGTYLAGPTTVTADIPYDLYTGDFNRDSKLDLIYSAGSQVVVALGNNDGTFQQLTSISDDPSNFSGSRLSVGLFDSDSNLDFVSESASNVVRFYRGLGTGFFQSPIVVAANASRGIETADFDRNGFTDIAFGDSLVTTRVDIAFSTSSSPLIIQPSAFAPTQFGSTQNAIVATFTDSVGSLPSDYTVTIDWGDGTITSGAVAKNLSGGWNVIGSHQYTTAGSVVFKVTVIRLGNQFSDTWQLNVVDAPPIFSASNLQVTTLAHGLVQINGTFQNPSATEDHFVSVNWGDGLPISVLPLTHGQRQFTLQHRFASSGNFPVEVSVSDFFGASSASLVLPIVSTNSAPSKPSNVALAAVLEDIIDAANLGKRVSEIVSSSGSSDPDGDAMSVAVTAINDNGHGEWQYSSNSIDWSLFPQFPSISGTSAYLLQPSDRIRFMPDSDYNTASNILPSLSFRIWDQTVASAHVQFDPTGSTAFSADFAAITQVVTAVNDAPTFLTFFSEFDAKQGVPVNIPEIAIDDVDAGSNPVSVTLSVGHGSLTAAPSPGITISSNNARVVLTGSIANLNAYLSEASANVLYTASLSSFSDQTFFDVDNLAISISDQGNSGQGGAITTGPENVSIFIADGTPPVSRIDPLPATLNNLDILLSGTASDPPGSGIAFVDVYVSVDGSAFTLWKHVDVATDSLVSAASNGTDIIPLSGTFTGQYGHTYGFCSIATDFENNQEQKPLAAEVSTMLVDNIAPTSSVATLPLVQDSLDIPVSWDGSDGNGVGIKAYEIFVSDNGKPFTLWLRAPENSKSAVYRGSAGHRYSFYSAAIDFSDNREIVDGTADAATLLLGQKQAVFSNSVLYVGGTNAADTIVVSRAKDTTRLQVTINGATISIVRGDTKSSSIALSSIQQVGILSRDGNDKLSLNNIPKRVDADGGNGADTIVASGPASASTFVVSTASVTMNGAVYNLSGIEALTANGKDANDKFLISTGAGLPDFSITVVGGGGSDTLMGPAFSNIWKISGNNSGSLTSASGSSLKFSKTENLVGGIGTDNFVFGVSAKISGKIKGGSSTNTLDFSAYRTPVSVNLATSKATGTGGIAGIGIVLGGSGKDALTGDANSNFLCGNGGDDVLIGGGGADVLMGGRGNDKLTAGNSRDLLFGGSGADKLKGGAEEDILFNSATSLDADRVAIDAVFTFWNRTDLDFDNRVSQLRFGINGIPPLTAAVSETDNNSDSILGGDGLDWFFVESDLDTTDLKPGEAQN